MDKDFGFIPHIKLLGPAVRQGARQCVDKDRLLAKPPPAVHAELEVDVLDVLLNGPPADGQALGDLSR
jgi:hypothetical protein